MTIYRAGTKNPARFHDGDEGKRMNRYKTTKIILTVAVTCALTLSAARAGTIKPVSPATSGFSIQNSSPTLQPQLSLSGNSIFTTPASFSLPPSSGGFTPVSGGPGQVTTQPVVPATPVRTPDSGSTIAFLALSVLGLAVIRSRLIRT